LALVLPHYKALRQKEPITYKNAVVVHEGGSQMVDITVNPLNEPEALRGMIMIVFTDVVTANVIKSTNPNGRILVVCEALHQPNVRGL
jgi:two-component system CheB/CheR fusion protein